MPRTTPPPRRTPARTPASHPTPARRRRRPRARRWPGVLVALVVGTGVAGWTAGEVHLQTAASSFATAVQSGRWTHSGGSLTAPGAGGPANPTSPTVDIAPLIPRPEPVSVFVPPVVPRGVSPSTSPPPASCGGYGTPRQINPGVVPGRGSATVSWQADGRSDVVGYQVQAVSQKLVVGPQPQPLKRTVGQPAGCGAVSVVVTGLRRGEPYVFWLEEQVRDDAAGVTRFVQVGTSAIVTIG